MGMGVCVFCVFVLVNGQTFPLTINKYIWYIIWWGRGEVPILTTSTINNKQMKPAPLSRRSPIAT